MQCEKKIKFKVDQYMKRRGKPSLLELYCAECETYVISYQKDGPGPLLRCYLDRIHHPEELAEREKLPFNTKTFEKLSCPNCKTVIGSPIIYEKEERPAYHLRPGFFHSKKVR